MIFCRSWRTFIYRRAPLKLLIFDIDGTLTHLDGATRRAFNAAFLAAFGAAAQIEGIPMHGRTDPVIFRDCFFASGFDGDWKFAYAAFQPHYLRALPSYIATSQKKKILPGVSTLLQNLANHPQAALALGTGNMEPGAREKIGHFQLNHFFPVGGFGDQYEVRSDILREAVQNAQSFYGQTFDPRDTWVIGDTIYDIEGGIAIGAQTLGVATGGAFSEQDLRQAGATIVMADLSNTQAVMHTFGL